MNPFDDPWGNAWAPKSEENEILKNENLNSDVVPVVVPVVDSDVVDTQNTTINTTANSIIESFENTGGGWGPVPIEPHLFQSNHSISYQESLNFALVDQHKQQSFQHSFDQPRPSTITTKLVTPISTVVDFDPLGALTLDDNDDDEKKDRQDSYQNEITTFQEDNNVPSQRQSTTSLGELNAPIDTKYQFTCSVLEPLKVGDRLSGHVEYRVKTETNHPDYRNKECSVMRRFSDFLWLYTQLASGNQYPGVIVPPIPDKQAVGRFEEQFIELRRLQLESFIKRIVSHPILQQSKHLMFFLECEAFSNDKKNMTEKTIMGISELVPMTSIYYPPVPDNHKELEEKRKEMMELENGLIVLAKSLDTMTNHRKELSGAIIEMGASFGSLESSKISNDLLRMKLSKLSEIHTRIGEINSRHADKDISLLCTRVDEYVRMIGSCKISFLVRNTLYDRVCVSEQNLEKRKELLGKYDNMKIRTDKISAAATEVSKAQNEVEEHSNTFKKCSELLVKEIDRMNLIKISDFRSSLESFCKVMLECHKEMLMFWKSYYDITPPPLLNSNTAEAIVN